MASGIAAAAVAAGLLETTAGKLEAVGWAPTNDDITIIMQAEGGGESRVIEAPKDNIKDKDEGKGKDFKVVDIHHESIGVLKVMKKPAIVVGPEIAQNMITAKANDIVSTEGVDYVVVPEKGGDYSATLLKQSRVGRSVFTIGVGSTALRFIHHPNITIEFHPDPASKYDKKLPTHVYNIVHGRVQGTPAADNDVNHAAGPRNTLPGAGLGQGTPAADAGLRNMLPGVDLDGPNRHRLLIAVYSTLHFNFNVVDLNFSEVIDFIGNVSDTIRRALLLNDNVHIHMSFTTDVVDDHMLEGFDQWLYACDGVNEPLQEEASVEDRIPWNYHAREEDMFAHLEWESAVKEWNVAGRELDLMKRAFQQAPMQ